jgi:hypothetical protein
VFQKPLLLGQLTRNTTNTALLLLCLHGLGEGIIFPLIIGVFAALPQGPLSHLRGALAVEANIT